MSASCLQSFFFYQSRHHALVSQLKSSPKGDGLAPISRRAFLCLREQRNQPSKTLTAREPFHRLQMPSSPVTRINPVSKPKKETTHFVPALEDALLKKKALPSTKSQHRSSAGHSGGHSLLFSTTEKRSLLVRLVKVPKRHTYCTVYRVKAV